VLVADPVRHARHREAGFQQFPGVLHADVGQHAVDAGAEQCTETLFEFEFIAAHGHAQVRQGQGAVELLEQDIARTVQFVLILRAQGGGAGVGGGAQGAGLLRKQAQGGDLQIQHAARAGVQVTPDLVFRDPYMLDFLGLPHDYSERELEDAILREMERFLLELGTSFTFVARQKRISIGADDFYLDLLFYHCHLRRLVAVELKLEKFQPAHKGQMELYLRWLDKYDRAPGEEAPIGLILCAAHDREQVELLDLDAANIRVAEYLAHIPDMKVLQAQLRRAWELAREQTARAVLSMDT